MCVCERERERERERDVRSDTCLERSFHVDDEPDPFCDRESTPRENDSDPLDRDGGRKSYLSRMRVLTG